LRYEDKQKKYEGVDADRLRRELIYSRVMTSRILGFGQGGIALARGRYVEARGWLIGASQILSTLGQDTWRKSLEVYSRSATVMLAESAERLREEGLRLQQLQEWFAERNRRNGFVAGAFGLLAEVRARQLEAETSEFLFARCLCRCGAFVRKRCAGPDGMSDSGPGIWPL
jgi:hypothetical protein